MLAKYTAENKVDKDGNPAGGFANGTGLDIRWQNGPLGKGTNRIPANGAFVETVLDAVANRIKFYQESKFKCKENEVALIHINEALSVLDSRTKSRELAGVEGTHEVIN